MSGLRLLLLQGGTRSVVSSPKDCLEDADFPGGCLLSRFSGEPSAEALAQAKPDVVLVEHASDRKVALQTVRKLRSLCAYIPIVLLAWESSEEFVIDALNAGVSRYLKLPSTGCRLERL